MRDHELELIAALAEGSLEDEAEARALIASSEEARVEFDAQKSALEALSGISSARMSETERASLRRDLWTHMRGVEPSRTSPTPWYSRWVPVAAGMFVLIGLVAVLSQGGFSGLSGAGDEAALEAETTAAATEDGDDMSEQYDRDGSDGGAPGAPTSTAADAGDGIVTAQAPPDAAAFYSDQADEIRTHDVPESSTFGEVSTTELDACLERAGLGDYEVREADPDPGTRDDTGLDVPEEAVAYLAAIPSGADPATAPVVFVSLDTCEVIHVDR